ncbi:MAG: sugar phosphate isomerase/epimerase [Chitinophagaceae bacterium]|nr:sugar phosphate isomerase/epimerase [Chitinophagaceae bacterium]
MNTRRDFIKKAGLASLALQVQNPFPIPGAKVQVCAHIWVYASRYPPNWDCTPILDEVFGDLSYAGYAGVEIMEPILGHNDSVERLKELQQKYSLPVIGTSYGGKMYLRNEHQQIVEDVELVTERLSQVGGKQLGISVGDAGRKKTEEELDAQADVLKKIMQICGKRAIIPNLHNHTYEMEYEMTDFKGTIARVPDIKLGPDLNWLMRAKIDPVWFIKEYGDKMVYMHLRDQDASGKWTEALGEGVADFKAISKALKDIRYTGSAAVELAFDKPPVNPVRESWKKSRQYVKKIFNW